MSRLKLRSRRYVITSRLLKKSLQVADLACGLW
jgi:hypothetical protein